MKLKHKGRNYRFQVINVRDSGLIGLIVKVDGKKYGQLFEPVGEGQVTGKLIKKMAKQIIDQVQH